MTREPAGAAVLRPDLTDAVLDAVLQEFAEVGYGRLSMQRVATRAGVGKSALYRRWPGKEEMVADAMARLGVPEDPPPDTGSLRGDLRALGEDMRAWLTTPAVRPVTSDLLAELARSPGLAEVFRSALAGPRRRRARAVLDAAVRRGEVPDDEILLDLVVDVLGSAPYWRMTVLGEEVDDGYLDRLAGLLAQGLAV
ncbi:TetR/AcrR family transcriptional regulator [Actinomycetospora atypica]|uniref:TetR/AcrR family transcriptional regulator n=1 Tax=Actinomycetospora atypica TaxID=1290095 RepID=A0ABV9YLG1_9PSEU